MEEKIIRAKTKGYNVLKGALDGDIEYNTIIRAKHLYEDGYDYDYYIYEKDNMFHRCNSEGKLGMKYQDRFLNYKVLDKDFEFYKVLEEEKKIPEKLKDINSDFYVKDCYYEKLSKEEIALDLVSLKKWINSIIDYLKSKGE